MPRRNKNVRQRNVPRAAQQVRAPRGHSSPVEDSRPYSRQALARFDALYEIALDSELSSPPAAKQ